MHGGQKQLGAFMNNFEFEAVFLYQKSSKTVVNVTNVTLCLKLQDVRT